MLTKPRRKKSENYLLGCGIKSSCSLLQQFRILFHVLTESLIESCFFLLSFLLFGRFRVRFGHSFLRSQPIGYLTFFLRWLDHRLIIVFFTITTRTKKKLRFTVASNSRRKTKSVLKSFNHKISPRMFGSSRTSATTTSPSFATPRPGSRVPTLAPERIPPTQTRPQSRRQALFRALLELRQHARFNVSLPRKFVRLLILRFRMNARQWFFRPIFV